MSSLQVMRTKNARRMVNGSSIHKPISHGQTTPPASIYKISRYNLILRDTFLQTKSNVYMRISQYFIDFFFKCVEHLHACRPHCNDIWTSFAREEPISRDLYYHIIIDIFFLLFMPIFGYVQWRIHVNNIYVVGYTISLIAILLSLAILGYFRYV